MLKGMNEKSYVYKGYKVYTTNSVSRYLQESFEKIREVLSKNRNEFSDGKDYFSIADVSKLRFKLEGIHQGTQKVYLWTEKGIRKLIALFNANEQVSFADVMKANKSTEEKLNSIAEPIDIEMLTKMFWDEIGIGRNNMFKALRKKKVLQSNNVPYQEYMNRGYFKLKKQKRLDSTSGLPYYKVLVTKVGAKQIVKWAPELGKLL